MLRSHGRAQYQSVIEPSWIRNIKRPCTLTGNNGFEPPLAGCSLLAKTGTWHFACTFADVGTDNGGPMKAHILIAALSASICTTAYGADTYAVDPNHTGVVFAFKHLGFSTFHGKIPATGGTIVLDRAQKTGTAEITFDIKTIATGVPKFDEHLRSPDFFDVAQWSTATFKSTQMTFKGDAPASVTGDLTIKGKTKPVTLQITSFKCGDHPMLKVPACGANATAKIKRSDFGLEKSAPAVSDDMDLAIEVEAAAKK
jgi:polyisoprenoid-binding protein YceI